MTIADRYAAIVANNEAMAANVPDVYAAGQKSMVDESKLLPTTVSGSYISLDDVSEVPHEVSCKIESVNLIDANKLNMGYGISVDNKNDFAVYPNWYTTDLIAVLPNTTYILNGTSSCGRVEYDNNAIPIVWLHSAVTDYTFTTNKNTYYVRFNSLIDGYSKPKLIRQIDFSTVHATKYGANKDDGCQSLTPTADGTVEGMTSTSPYLNIFTDAKDVNIKVTYNKSWGMHEAQERFCDVFNQEIISNSISFERLTLSKESTTSIINALSSTVTGQNVTFKKSAKELFTDDEWAALVATKPNWTFSLI